MERQDMIHRLWPVLLVSAVLAIGWVVLQAWPAPQSPPQRPTVHTVMAGAVTIETAIGAVVDQGDSVRDAIDGARTVLVETMHSEVAQATDATIAAIRQEAALLRQTLAALPQGASPPAADRTPPAATPAPATADPKPIRRVKPPAVKAFVQAPPRPQPAPLPEPAAIVPPPWTPRFPRPEARPDPDWRDAILRH